MPQNDRERNQRDYSYNQQNRQRGQQSRDRMDRDPYNREQDSDWAQQVPNPRSRSPYRDYGWERGQSALPEFRDPGVHVQPYEREEVSEYRRVNWNRDYDYGIAEDGPYVGVGPKGYQRSDERIFDDVCQRLTRHGRIDASNMQVNVQNGEVTLTGSVDSRQTKHMAEQVAEQVQGVKDVHNQLRVDQQQGRGMGQNRNMGQNQGRNESGMPGGGQGRTDEVGGSGVYPASGPMPQGNAPVQGEASWGQGDRGAAGYQDSGSSELNMPNQQDKGKQQGQQGGKKS